MPRKLQIRNRYFVGFIIEAEVAMRLQRIARAQGLSVSELCRRIITEHVLRAPEEPQRAAAAPGATDGAAAETASERRWRMMVKLDEPMVEALVKDAERLESVVAELEKAPISVFLLSLDCFIQ